MFTSGWEEEDDDLTPGDAFDRLDAQLGQMARDMLLEADRRLARWDRDKDSSVKDKEGNGTSFLAPQGEHGGKQVEGGEREVDPEEAAFWRMCGRAPEPSREEREEAFTKTWATAFPYLMVEGVGLGLQRPVQEDDGVGLVATAPVVQGGSSDSEGGGGSSLVEGKEGLMVVGMKATILPPTQVSVSRQGSSGNGGQEEEEDVEVIACDGDATSRNQEVLAWSQLPSEEMTTRLGLQPQDLWGRSTKGMLGRGGEEEVGFLESPEDTLANDLTQEIMDRIWRGLCDKLKDPLASMVALELGTNVTTSTTR